MVNERSVKNAPNVVVDRTGTPPRSGSMRYVNPLADELTGNVVSSDRRNVEIASRVAAAAASSRAKSPVGIERFVRRNERALVIVDWASAARGIAAVETTIAVSTIAMRWGIIPRFLLFLGDREGESHNCHRSRAVVAGVVRRHRVHHVAV